MNQPVPPFRLDQLFVEQATRTPQAPALLGEMGSMSFAELNRASDRLAMAIRSRGIRDGSFVGLHMERTSRYVVSVLAVLKANAAVVPLPPSYPYSRLREILAFAALDAIIDDHDTPLDPHLHERIWHAPDLGSIGAEMPKAVPGGPDEPAFVLCSSGSTGKPKMVVRSHRSFFHRLLWTWNTHPYEPGEVCCQKAYMTTTHAVYELFEPLLRGIPVCIIPDQQAKTLEPFWHVIRRQAISRLLLVPSVLQASLDMPGFAPPDIKVLVLMGEYVSARLAARAAAAFPLSTKIYSIYGSTEASSTLVCDVRKSVQLGGELPLGEPISPDIRTHVLDDDLAPVDAGAEGMLYLAGPALFSGYFRDPALTEAAFAMLDGGERVYRTNDRVRRTVANGLEFLGRVDHTVKIRGFRVDLQEVEKTIALLPAASQCAVIAKDDHDGSAALVAFVTPATVSPTDVYRLLREHLPDYMMPSRVIVLATIPLTANGKVDRRKLLETCNSRVESSGFHATGSETELRVATAWKTVLGHDTFEPDSNFFEVGGDSLKTFSLIARLRDAFGLERHQLPDNAIYRFPTIKGLASHIDDARLHRTAAMPLDESILVTLKSGSDASAPPLFVISSAGGTLGAYAKVVRALQTTREVIGVRDPFLWDKRDPTAGFRNWVTLYLDAIRGRQPEGPYYLLAYSSAAAFGYEIARQLRGSGAEVALLALIDPLAMDKDSKWRFGHWAMRARFMRRDFLPIVQAAGSLRRLLPRRRSKNGRSAATNDFALTGEQFRQFETRVRTSREHILALSALLELNTGLPFAMTDSELDEVLPEQYVHALLDKVHRTAPDVDAVTIEKLIVQYQLQVKSQHHYRLQAFQGTLVLFDPEGPYQGLLALQFRPYVQRLIVHGVALASPAGCASELAKRFSGPLRSHYLCMRDDAFAQTLARKLEKLL